MAVLPPTTRCIRNTCLAPRRPPALGEFVEAISTGLEEGMNGSEPPRLVLETGRALVDDAGWLVATVVGNKRLIDKRRAVILDAGVNILPTAWWYKHEIHPAQDVFRYRRADGILRPPVQ